MRGNQGTVYHVDQDGGRRNQVRSVAHQLGYEYQACNEATQLALRESFSLPGCLLVSDFVLTQAEHRNGRLITNFQDYSSGGRLNLVGRGTATVVICEQPDVQKIVRYMRAGALNVLPTPLVAESLSHWIEQAINADYSRLREEERLEQIINGYKHLSERKRTVLQHMIDGRASKWSAHELDVSRRTIELDRAEILNAFGVSNAIELARLVTETKCLPLNFAYRQTMGNSSLAVAK